MRIRSKSSTSSPKVGRSIGLYCQHSRIKRYLQEQSIKSIKSIKSINASNPDESPSIHPIRMTINGQEEKGDLHFQRAADGFLHAVAIAEQLEELLDVGDGGVGRPAQRHNLPEEDAEGPHVRLAGVDALEQGFGRHPLDGQPAVGGLPVVLVHVDVSRQSEIGDLEHAVVAD